MLQSKVIVLVIENEKETIKTAFGHVDQVNPYIYHKYVKARWDDEFYGKLTGDPDTDIEKYFEVNDQEWFDWCYVSIADPDKIGIVWCVEDVLGQADEDGITINIDEAREILEIMERLHDAVEGINWEYISSIIYQFDADRQAELA